LDAFDFTVFLLIMVPIAKEFQAERAAVRATIDRIEAASGTRPLGWLGAGLAERGIH
jgi:hypothetical protein